MLNELHTLAAALEAADIPVATNSPLLRTNKKQEGIRLWINRAGELVKADTLPADEVKHLQRYEKANGEGFPSFNLGPIFDLGSLRTATIKRINDEIKRESSRQIVADIIFSPTADAARALSDTRLKKLRKSLNDIPERLTPSWGRASLRFSPISLLIQALLTKKWEPEPFVTETVAVIRRSIVSGEFPLSGYTTVLELLYSKDHPILLELHDAPSDSASITSIDMRRFLHSTLLQEERQEQSALKEEALTGERRVLTNRFPCADLPLLGRSYIFSCPPDLPCQFRYGLSEGSIFPTSSQLANKLHDGLLHVAKPERENKTWISMPGDSKSAQELLVAYVDEFPEYDGDLASMIGNSGQSATFDSACQNQLAAITKLQKHETETHVTLILIRKADPGRRQINFHARLTVEHLRRAVSEWEAGQRNLPEMRPFTFRERNSSETNCLNQRVLFPSEVFQTINSAWCRGTDQCNTVSNIRLREVFQILLNAESTKEEVVPATLAKVVLQWDAFVAAFGDRVQAGDFRGLSDAARRFAPRACTTLAHLLYLSNRTKEAYMNDIAFNLGKMLACANQLHLRYCEIVRRGDVPPQLIGSSLFRTALELPAQAISRLAERIAPYEAWATTFGRTKDTKGHEQAGLVKFHLIEFQRLSQSVPREKLTVRFSDSDKAEMFLGFMAKFQGNKSQQPSTETAA